ncbi:MAG: SAM-dependent methyltransferase [Phycisphaerae bacterium]
MSTKAEESGFVSRAGLKLASAMDHFRVDPTGLVCADLGANVGGFTDCLLRRGAGKVYSVETGFGVLEYKLRKDPRVVVMERTNALHVRLPELVDLAVIDLGWTPQRLILPRVRELIKPEGQIISLIKPHYESAKELLHLRGGVLDPSDSEKVFRRIVQAIPEWKLTVIGWMQSPITGMGGNVEYLVLLKNFGF